MSHKDPERKLALNRWEPGQILRPEHFRAQEEALLETTVRTARLAGLPWYGVARLAWNDKQLAEGTVLITDLTVVFGPGQLVVLGSNAKLSQLTLDVKGSSTSLYLSIDSVTERTMEVPFNHESAPDVSRDIYRFRLSTTEPIDNSAARLKLAVLEKVTTGWQLSSTYVPPLLQVGPNPFLRALIKDVGDTAAAVYQDLRRELLGTFCRGEAMAAARRGQLAAYRMRTVLADLADLANPANPANPANLADLDGRVCRHPYYYLEALRDFHLELCQLKNVEPASIDPRGYNHDDLAGCFNTIAKEIKRLAVDDSGPVPSLDFTRKDDGATFVATPFPDALVGAASVYLVVQRKDKAPTVSFEDIKLASPTQLDRVQISSLRGVRLKRVEASVQQSFGPWVDVYQLQCAHSEAWGDAVRERAIAYYARSGMVDIPTALFWRTP